MLLLVRSIRFTISLLFKSIRHLLDFFCLKLVLPVAGIQLMHRLLFFSVSSPTFLPHFFLFYFLLSLAVSRKSAEELSEVDMWRMKQRLKSQGVLRFAKPVNATIGQSTESFLVQSNDKPFICFFQSK